MDSSERKPPRLAIVVPCFNEGAVIERTAARLADTLEAMVRGGKLDAASFICFVDDGSTDQSWQLIEQWHARNAAIHGLKLSRNFGQQSALLGGLMRVRERADCAVTIDADLQQDEGAIERFVDRYRAGAEIVLGVRMARDTDTWFKRVTASLFYSVMKLLGTKVVGDHADYRLLGSRALAALEGYSETNLFLRGIVADLGFKCEAVTIEVRERSAGVSKYPPMKMAALAFEAITSFSVVPLRVITVLGFVIFLLSLAMIIFILGAWLFASSVVPGWASTLLPIYFIGGVQLMCVGLVGEYVGKVYREVKARPRFIVENEL